MTNTINNYNNFQEFATNVNGQYVKLYVTSSMQTVKFLENSGALVLYYNFKDINESGDNFINNDDANIFQLYLNNTLLFSGNGFNNENKDKICEVINDYVNNKAKIEEAINEVKKIDTKVDKNDFVDNNKINVNDRSYTLHNFLQKIQNDINDLNIQVDNFNISTKNIALNYKFKSIIITYTRCIYNSSINTPEIIRENTIQNVYSISSPTSSSPYDTLNNIIPIETYEYKIGEKNYLPIGSRILNIEVNLEVLNVYQNDTKNIAFIFDWDFKQLNNNGYISNSSNKNIFYKQLTGGDLVQTQNFVFNINYTKNGNSNITHDDGYIIENNKNVLLNNIYYVDNVVIYENSNDSSEQDNLILGELDWNNNILTQSQNKFYNIYSLFINQLEIYGYEEIYYNYCSDNIIFNDLYNYVCSEEIQNITNGNKGYLNNVKNNVQFKGILDNTNNIELPLHYYFDYNRYTHISNFNTLNTYTPITITKDEKLDKYVCNISKLIIAIPNKYLIDDVQLNIEYKNYSNIYNISYHTKLIGKTSHMPKYFSLPGEHINIFSGDGYVTYQYSSQYNIYSINNISIVLKDDIGNYTNVLYNDKCKFNILKLLIHYHSNDNNININDIDNIDMSNNVNNIVRDIMTPLYGDIDSIVPSDISSIFTTNGLRSILVNNGGYFRINNSENPELDNIKDNLYNQQNELFQENTETITKDTLINDNINKYWIDINVSENENLVNKVDNILSYIL